MLLLLVCAGLWGLRQQQVRSGRRDWRDTVNVDVVLLRRGAVPESAMGALRADLQRLEALLGDEFLRYRGQRMPPFSFVPHGPVDVSAPPPAVPDEAGATERVRHYLRLRDYFADVEGRGALRLRRHSLRLYVVLEPVRTRTRFVEGFGAVGGDFGVVRAAIDVHTVDQALVAIAHEVLHCLGATDKYDEEGHAVPPDGLVEPLRVPPYPQRYAEIMVGERPLAPGQGVLVESLGEARIGAITAMEIGWLPEDFGSDRPAKK